MKKIGFLPLVFVVLTAWFSSCTKDKAVINAAVVCDSTKTNYVHDVKPIMTDNCSFGGCHDGHTQSPDLTTYNGCVTGVNGNVICRIQATCTPLMPQGGPKLADSLINKIVKWKTDGYCDSVAH